MNTRCVSAYFVASLFWAIPGLSTPSTDPHGEAGPGGFHRPATEESFISNQETSTDLEREFDKLKGHFSSGKPIKKGDPFFGRSALAEKGCLTFETDKYQFKRTSPVLLHNFKYNEKQVTFRPGDPEFIKKGVFVAAPLKESDKKIWMAAHTNPTPENRQKRKDLIKKLEIEWIDRQEIKEGPESLAFFDAEQPHRAERNLRDRTFKLNLRNGSRYYKTYEIHSFKDENGKDDYVVKITTLSRPGLTDEPNVNDVTYCN